MKKERSKELFSPESCSPVLSGGIRDFTVHGTEPVPLHIYHQDYAHGGLSVPFHWHKELEWIWVEKGTLTLTLKTETRTISEGTFLFINSHELHQLCSIGTPISYINQYRVTQAADLLTGSSLSILEIALDTGFESPSYFASIFRRTFGMSPEEYRKAMP